MAIESPYYPIVYVRGYAATMSEIEAAAADPYMGFNLGSALLRQDAQKRPVRFIFESPLLRLIKDHQYVDAFQNGGTEYAPGTAPPRSIWVFRYYEKVSDSLGSGERLSMEQFAADLRAFILSVRDAVCGGDAAARDTFKVNLVAHSMGGLVCRCYLQNLCRNGTGDRTRDRELELTGRRPPHYVAKLFTYGTPHNGIDLLGFNSPDLGAFDRLQIANFNRKRMREYLKLEHLPKDAPVSSLDGAFPVENTFCFIGSAYKDYEAFAGLSKLATGPMSDGLVMIRNAYVDGAPRAIAHRSHSGPYGIVNSEAGYQNLRRFLFGEYRVAALLAVDALTLPQAVQAERDAGKRIGGAYHFDVVASVRNALYHLNERRYDNSSALVADFDDLVGRGKPLYLFTGYLLKAAKAKDVGDQALVFTLDIGVHVPLFEVAGTFFKKSYIGGYIFRERINFAVRDGTIRYGLASQHGDEAPTQAEVTERDGQRSLEVALATPETARPGFAGRLLLEIAAQPD